jgi:hypothetical protein
MPLLDLLTSENVIGNGALQRMKRMFRIMKFSSACVVSDATATD